MWWLVDVAAWAIALYLGWYLLWQPGAWAGISYKTIGYGVIGLAILATIRVASQYREIRSALAFAWVPAGTVSELIQAWNPENCYTHKEYQKSLAAHLAEKLPDVSITLESGSSRVRADIEVGKSVIVEVKTCFDSTSRLQQLIGQVELYKREFPGRAVIVLFVGKTNRTTLMNFKEAIARDVKVWVIRK